MRYAASAEAKRASALAVSFRNSAIAAVGTAHASNIAGPRLLSQARFERFRAWDAALRLVNTRSCDPHWRDLLRRDGKRNPLVDLYRTQRRVCRLGCRIPYSENPTLTRRFRWARFNAWHQRSPEGCKQKRAIVAAPLPA